MALSNGSPCAACKFLRRKCTAECVFAPYFPPEDPQKFANVHKLFGASNVSKLLNDLPLCARDDAVSSLAYEADARIKDPVYGCVGAISILQCKVAQLQAELFAARSELCRLKAQRSNDPVDSQLCKLPSDHLLPSCHNQLHQMRSPYCNTLPQSTQLAAIHPSSASTAAFTRNPAASAPVPSFSSPSSQAPTASALTYLTSSSTFPGTMHPSTSLPSHKEASSPTLSSSTLACFNTIHSPAGASSFALSDCSSRVGHGQASCTTDRNVQSRPNSATQLHMATPIQLGLLLPQYATSSHHNIDSSSSSNTKTSRACNGATHSSPCSFDLPQVIKLEPESSQH